MPDNETLEQAIAAERERFTVPIVSIPCRDARCEDCQGKRPDGEPCECDCCSHKWRKKLKRGEAFPSEPQCEETASRGPVES